MATKKIHTQLDVIAVTDLADPGAGYVGFGSKVNGFYQKIGSNADEKLLVASDIGVDALSDDYVPIWKSGKFINSAVTINDNGKLVLAANAAEAPLNFSNTGTADPTTTVNGDVWFRSNALYFKSNTTVRTIAHTASWSAITTAAIDAGVETTSRFITAARLKYGVETLGAVVFEPKITTVSENYIPVKTVSGWGNSPLSYVSDYIVASKQLKIVNDEWDKWIIQKVRSDGGHAMGLREFDGSGGLAVVAGDTNYLTISRLGAIVFPTLTGAGNRVLTVNPTGQLVASASYLLSSDIYDWAKAATKPSYNYNEVGAAPASTVSFPGFGSSSGTACSGDDARLYNARDAADVYAWAKAATKPSYTYNEVGAAAASHSHSYEPPITKGTTAQYFRGDMSLATFPTSMPASDVYAWAKNSSMPVATTTSVGGVKVDGTTITINNGVISANGGAAAFDYWTLRVNGSYAQNIEPHEIVDLRGSTSINVSFVDDGANGDKVYFAVNFGTAAGYAAEGNHTHNVAGMLRYIYDNDANNGEIYIRNSGGYTDTLCFKNGAGVVKEMVSF